MSITKKNLQEVWEEFTGLNQQKLLFWRVLLVVKFGLCFIFILRIKVHFYYEIPRSVLPLSTQYLFCALLHNILQFLPLKLCSWKPALCSPLAKCFEKEVWGILWRFVAFAVVVGLGFSFCWFGWFIGWLVFYDVRAWLL